MPFISTKTVFGHALGASGPVNLAAGALMVHRGDVLPSFGTVAPRAAHQTEDADASRGTPHVARGIVFACGMGGLMCACLLEREEPARQ